MAGDVGQALSRHTVHGDTDRPVEVGRGLGHRHVDDESGPAILLDERADVGHARQRRIGASFVGAQRRRRSPGSGRDSRRPTVSASSSARSASARSRWSTCRAPVTCSSIAASVCPARSCSSRAMRRRSSATSWSASARRACSSCSINRCWRYTARPRVKVNSVGEHPRPPRDLRLRGDQLRDQQRERSCGTRDDQGPGQGSEMRRRDEHHHHAEEERSLQRAVASHDERHRHDDHHGEHLGGKSRDEAAEREGTRPLAPAAIRSPAVPGSVSWAATTITTAVTTRKPSSSRLVGTSGRARSARQRRHRFTGEV